MRIAKVIFITSLTFSWFLIGAYYTDLIDDSFLGDSTVWAEESHSESMPQNPLSTEKVEKDEKEKQESVSDSSLTNKEELISTNHDSSLTQDFSQDGHTFKIEEIPTLLMEQMESKNPIDPTIISYDRLRLVTVTYHGFDNQPHQGQLIVHREVAEDIIEIFKEVFAAQYPIEKIGLLEDYNYSDRDSMADNNSSAFNFRNQTDSQALSMHAYGLAIDINPVQNPYVTDDYFLPTNAMLYLDRTKETKGMIQKGDALYEAFISRGWTWGGDWSSIKDYQHFEKRID